MTNFIVLFAKRIARHYGMNDDRTAHNEPTTFTLHQLMKSARRDSTTVAASSTVGFQQTTIFLSRAQSQSPIPEPNPIPITRSRVLPKSNCHYCTVAGHTPAGKSLQLLQLDKEVNISPTKNPKFKISSPSTTTASRVVARATESEI